MNSESPAKTSADRPPVAHKRGLRPHQVMMLILGALALFMIVGGVVSVLEESRLPAPAARTAP